MQNFEATLFKNPSYENMFKKLVEMYEGKDETKKADQGDPLNNYQSQLQREKIQKEDEDLNEFGNGADSSGAEEEEKYNQEMFLKMKADSEKMLNSPNSERLKYLHRRGSSGSDDDIGEEAEDMGIFGYHLAEFKQK